MATVQDSPKTTTRAKYEIFVETQLARARDRVRLLDITAAGLGLLSGVLAFTLGMVLLDRWLVLPSLMRQVALAGFALAALLYMGGVLFWLWSRRVNPYYAARQVEQTVPGAKNSLVNWLDLHSQKLPPAIRSALGTRAAKDLSEADLERAIRGRPTFWMMAVTAVLVLATVVAFVILRPDPFFSLLGRTFAPFREGTIATRTRIAILQPVGGDALVPISQPVTFLVQVQGKQPDPNKPDAVKLLFRYNQTDPVYEERRLDPVPSSGGDWSMRLPAYQVNNGFWYKVTGGDFETNEYRVQVRSLPLLTGSEVTYHYRPYLHWADTTTRDPNLEALRGTEVTLVAHTNRTVKEGRLQIDGDAQPLAAQLDPAQPDALRFKFLMDRDGEYRIRFTSVEGEANPEPMPYRIRVLRDYPPQVMVTAPAENVELPANGVLLLLGKATDDIGLTGMTLRMKVKDGPALKAKPYRDGMSFRLADGSYPRALEYMDMVELDKVKLETGLPFALKAGMEVEYWLEAADNCDYPPPGPNVGQSDKFIIKITEPNKDEKKTQQERDQARQAQQQHEKKQDEELKKENQAAQQRAEEQQNPPQQPQTPKQKDDAKQQEQKDKKVEQDADNLKELVKEQEQKEGGPRGDGKDEGKQDPKGDRKDKPENDAKGQDKPQPGQQAKQESGKGKDEGKPDAKGEKGQNKPDAKPHPGQESGEKKDQPQAGQQSGQAKNGGQPEAKPDQGKNDGSDKPSPKPDQLTGEGKNGGKAQPNAPKGEGKNNVQANTDSSGKPGEPKGEDPSQAKGTGKKQPTDAGTGKDSKPGEAKDEGNMTAGGGKTKGDSKPATQEPKNSSGVAKAEAKDPGNKKPVAGDDRTGAGREKPVTKEDMKNLAEKLGSSDPKEQQEAQQKLNEMAQEMAKKLASSDPKERQEALNNVKELAKEMGKDKEFEDAMKKAGLDPKDGHRNQPSAAEGSTDASKGNPPGKDESAGKNKTESKGDKGTPKGDAKKSDDAKQGDDANAVGKGKPGGPGPMAGENKPANSPPVGTTPGGGDRNNDMDAAARAIADALGLDAEAVNPNNKKRPGELQLEEFRNKVTPEMLQQLKMTKEEYAAFLKAYQEKLRREARAPRPKETLPGPQRGGTLTNDGPRRVNPGATAKPDDLNSTGPSLPPPELRNAYKEFTEELSKLKRSKK